SIDGQECHFTFTSLPNFTPSKPSDDLIIKRNLSNQRREEGFFPSTSCASKTARSLTRPNNNIYLKVKRMTKLDQDQDCGNQWSSLLDFNSYFDPTSYCTDLNNQNTDYMYQGQYMRGYHCGDINRDCNYIGDGEVNQEQMFEEFARLEVTDSSHVEENQFQTSCVPSDWNNSSYTNYWPGYTAQEGCMEDADGLDPSTSCSSAEEISYDGDDYSRSLDLMDDVLLDGELGKRINQLIPVPHVPRINREIPSVDEATSDHQRLLDRLQVYDLVERKVQGDGNCQFRSLSDQFYRTTAHHKFVRQQVVDQLTSNRDHYEGYVPMDYDEYLEKMSKGGEWGDHVSLQAAADSYGVKIFIITSFKDTCYIEILPKVEKSKRVIFLSFWAEVHYNSIYPRGESSPLNQICKKKKKKWWRFGRKQ
ncbi:hypothetical protein V2J09_006635, partial [Rumex salicifolius]